MAKKKTSLADYEASPLAALSLRKDQGAKLETKAEPVPAAAEQVKETKQISAHIPKELYRDVKRALADAEDLTLTDLLTQLLGEWAKQRK